MSTGIREVAEKAEVSIATVSRVVNNSPRVDPETRKRVQQVIQETDYQPNITGMQLRTRKTFSIGIVSPHMGAFYHPYLYHIFGDTIRGVALGVRKTRYDIVLARPSMENEENADYLRLFKQGKVDGLIVIYPQSDDPNLSLVEEKGWPVVLLGSSYGQLDYVDVDNYQSTRGIMEHLIAQGHTRIGLINGRNNEECYRQRYTAYKNSLAEHGISLVPELVCRETMGDKDGFTQMQKLLVRRPTAVFAANDLFAAGAARAITEAGLSIPGDIALAGFSDTPQAVAVQPPLTTVRIPLAKMGAEAAGVLINRIENKNVEQQRNILPGELIIRQST